MKSFIAFLLDLEAWIESKQKQSCNFFLQKKLWLCPNPLKRAVSLTSNAPIGALVIICLRAKTYLYNTDYHKRNVVTTTGSKRQRIFNTFRSFGLQMVLDDLSAKLHGNLLKEGSSTGSTPLGLLLEAPI